MKYLVSVVKDSGVSEHYLCNDVVDLQAFLESGGYAPLSDREAQSLSSEDSHVDGYAWTEKAHDCLIRIRAGQFDVSVRVEVE